MCAELLLKMLKTFRFFRFTKWLRMVALLAIDLFIQRAAQESLRTPLTKGIVFLSLSLGFLVLFFFVFSTTAKKSRSEESEKQVLLSKFSLLRFPQYFAPRLQVDLYK